MQVIERDRRAPGCHTWAPGGRRTTEVGRIQPFAGQPFTMERNQQPGLSRALPGPAHTLTPLCAKCRLCCVETPASLCVCVSVQGGARTSPSINPALSACVRAIATRMPKAHVLWGGGACWTQQLVAEGGQPLSTGTQTLRVCLRDKQSSLQSP